MVTYIASLLAKPGRELAVTQFYLDQEPLLKAAPGYRGRQIFRARPGTLEAEVRRVTPPEELAGHAHEEGTAGVSIIIIEQWDSVADRVAFSRGASRARAKDLFPNLLPQHSHEFYDVVSPG